MYALDRVCVRACVRVRVWGRVGVCVRLLGRCGVGSEGTVEIEVGVAGGWCDDGVRRVVSCCLTTIRLPLLTLL